MIKRRCDRLKSIDLQQCAPIFEQDKFMKPSENNVIYDRVMTHISPSIQDTFTSAQQDALKAALQQSSWSKHRIDLRFTVPFPGRGFYCVFLAGPERRRGQRSSSKNESYAWAVSMALSGVALGGMLLVELAQQVPSMMTSWQTDNPHPTGIPWIQSKTNCQDSGRVWRDDVCWDAKHNPSF
jgi:hypothetical protein